MIVLDEQLLGRGLAEAIATWYRGSVRFITDLRPGTVIKDDAIPALLRAESQPTFVTINERDFWRKIAAEPGFCIVCVALSDARATLLPNLLKAVLHNPTFRTKARRVGCVPRVIRTVISYYAHVDQQVHTVPLD